MKYSVCSALILLTSNVGGCVAIDGIISEFFYLAREGPVELLVVAESHPALTLLPRFDPDEINADISRRIADTPPLSENLKIALVPFSKAGGPCYFPPPTPMHHQQQMNLATSIRKLHSLALEEGTLSLLFPPPERPSMQAALLAATDDLHVGFSPPNITNDPKVLRIVLIVTSTPAQMATEWISPPEADKRDHTAQPPAFAEGPAEYSPTNDDNDDESALAPPVHPNPCQMALPNVTNVAKVLRERDLYMVVLALGGNAAEAWETYGVEVEDGRYHVLKGPSVWALGQALDDDARAELMQSLLKGHALANLKKVLTRRGKAKGAEAATDPQSNASSVQSNADHLSIYSA